MGPKYKTDMLSAAHGAGTAKKELSAEDNRQLALLYKAIKIYNIIAIKALLKDGVKANVSYLKHVSALHYLIENALASKKNCTDPNFTACFALLYHNTSSKMHRIAASNGELPLNIAITLGLRNTIARPTSKSTSSESYSP